MQRYELPEGWEWRELRSIVQPKESWSFSKQPRELFLYVDISSVDNIAGVIAGAREIAGSKAPSRAKRVMRKGDVIFGTTRPYLKNVALVPDHLDNQICSTGFCVLRANRDQVMPEWIYHVCRGGDFINQIIPDQDKSAYPAVSDNEVLAAAIPLPPLPEQQRLVARIEEITRRAEEARALQKKAIEKANALLPAALSQVFSDSEEWNLHSVSEICEKPQYGYTQSATIQAIGPKFLRITDIQNGQVDWQDVPYCQCDNIDRYRLRSGDILFARTGATTGKSYLVGNCPEAIFASYLIRLRTKSEVLSHFLWWYFQSPNYWRQIFGGIEVSAQPNMNGKKLAALRVRVPPISEQSRIVAYLDGVRAKAEELKRQQQAIQTELDKIIPSVLSKAFQGEL